MMRVLIVEDNEFNALCLTRLFEATCHQVQVSVVHDSSSAMQQLEKATPTLVVLDGDLGASEAQDCNGPVLADRLWKKYPHISVVAWTDNDVMHTAFAEIFKLHNKHFNEYSSWSKVVSQKRIHQSLTYLTKENLTPLS